MIKVNEEESFSAGQRRVDQGGGRGRDNTTIPDDDQAAQKLIVVARFVVAKTTRTRSDASGAHAVGGRREGSTLILRGIANRGTGAHAVGCQRRGSGLILRGEADTAHRLADTI